jgi:hypothetical protein
MRSVFRNLLQGPSLTMLREVLAKGIVPSTVSSPEWQWGSSEHKAAPADIQDFLNGKGATMFRREDQGGPNQHEFPAMIEHIKQDLKLLPSTGPVTEYTPEHMVQLESVLAARTAQEAPLILGRASPRTRSGLGMPRLV